MSILLGKEIRCILPTWLAAIVALAGAAAASRLGGPRPLLNPLYGVMTILLAASSFGSEFQYKTMSLLISHPIDRARLWKSKMMVLSPALVSFAAVGAALTPYPPGNYLVKLAIHLAGAAMVFGIVPWLTLVCVDGLTGAVLSFVVIAVNEVIAKALFDAHPDSFYWWTNISSVLLGVMGCRRGYAKFLAWEWIAARPAGFVRPKAALARLAALIQPLKLRRSALCVLWCKELRIQAMSFAYLAVFCAGFGLVALLKRVLPGHLAWLKNFVRFYCVTFPVLVGALSVARERNLGLLEWQLSLPFSAIRQWSIKVVVCLLLGIGGGFFLPWALLRSRGLLPAWFSVGDYLVLSLLGTVITACASAMQRGTLKAAVMGVAAVFAVIFGSDVLRHLLVVTDVHRRFLFEIHTVADRFLLLGSMVIATAGLLWLAFKNFRGSVAARGRIGSAIGMAIFIVVFLASGLLSAARTARYHYTVPEKTNDGWETAHLSRESVEVSLIQELFARIKQGDYGNIHGVLLVKNGKLVAEEYFSGKGGDGKHRTFDRDTLHTLQSATKSVNSILIGIAIDRHLIADVEQPVSSLCPEYAGLFANEMKANIRLKHFLSMTLGLAWKGL